MTSGKTAGEVGSKPEIRMLQERWKDGKKETVTREEYKPLDFDADAAYALIAKESFAEDGSLESHTLKVNSAKLLAVFRSVVGDHPSLPSKFDRPAQISTPFTVLVHHWTDLEDARARATDTEEAAHLDLLLNFMRGELGKERQRHLDIVAKQRVSFNDLWMIFRPGDVQLVNERGHKWLLKLEYTAYENDSCSGRRFEVRCVHPFFDGEKIVRRRKLFKIFERSDVPGGALVRIDALPVYPRWVCADGPELEDALALRGERSAALAGTPVVAYDGLCEYCRSPPSSFFHWELDSFDTVWLPMTETARVVLDPKTFLEDFAKEAETIEGAFQDEFAAWATKSFGSLARAIACLSSPFTYGFSLQSKNWCKYYLDNISPVTWNPGAASSLILPGAEKALLSALVTSHRFPAAARDAAAQKGKGLVILLHGAAGAGKTLTAEVSAEAARAPLMPISLRELYEYKYFDELKLKTFLTYATTWRAVVLIDEADVFLEARSTGEGTSAERNALVAVFLRYLEYFAGIVFLTSNRVEDFDLAVKSRVHLALQYDPPQSELRARIWRQRLGALGDASAVDVEAVLPRLVEHAMNGREISNTINTALTLARSEHRPLDLAHLQTVIDVWLKFNDNLAVLRAAKEQKQRAGKDDRSMAGEVKAKAVNGTTVNGADGDANGLHRDPGNT